jgi:2-methylcitrate dehydratase PrpD
VREHAKHLILDGVACALVGAQLPVSRKGVQGVTALDDAGTGSLIGWGGRATSAPSAAMRNSSFIQGFELDDYHPLAPLHSNALVLPAMLAAAPHAGTVTGEAFLRGAILGYETGPRVGEALGGLEMIARGWHSGVVFGTVAAAAAAGTVCGLDAAGFEDALGMAATQSCGLMSAQFESMVKRMQHGFAARAGLTAAALAAVGYVGIKRVFERDYGGWLAVFGECHHPDASTIYEGLGSVWETERIAVKAYAAMGLEPLLSSGSTGATAALLQPRPPPLGPSPPQLPWQPRHAARRPCPAGPRLLVSTTHPRLQPRPLPWPGPSRLPRRLRRLL